MTVTSKSEEPAAIQSHVRALSHGLQILDMFSRDTRTVSVGEIAKALSIHKSTASRLAMTLASASYLEPTNVAGRYLLGTKITALQQFVSDPNDIERVVVPWLRELVESTGETGHVARLVGTDAVSSAVVDGWHTVRMRSWVGKRNPAYVSSMGKCLISDRDRAQLGQMYGEKLRPFTGNTASNPDELADQLASVRSNGFSTDDEELETGLRCIGAAIFGPQGDVVASISISGPSSRITRKAIPLLATHVRHYAYKASRGLGAPAVIPGWSYIAIDYLPKLPWVDVARAQRG